MTDEQFAEYVTLGHELTDVEFKGPGLRSDQPLAAKVVRAALGMANRRNGGFVIIGVKDKDGVLDPEGLSETQLASWQHYDNVADLLNGYADPPIRFELESHLYDGKWFVLLVIREFDEVPVLCKKLYIDKGMQDPERKKVLRDGACYVRPRRKHETVEVPTVTDMRDLLELATEKRLRRFIAQARAGGVDLGGESTTDDDLFERERAGWTSPHIDRIRSRGYWDVVVRPDRYVGGRVPSLAMLAELLRKAAVDERGWDYPYVDPRRDITRGVHWIEQETDRHDLEAWRFYQSGQFEDLFGFEDDWDAEMAPDQNKSISVEAILYRLTEIFLFAADLAMADDYQTNREMHIAATLHDLRDRVLYIATPGKVGLSKFYTADIEAYPLVRAVRRDELIAQPRELALAAATEVFDRFGWVPIESLLRSTQERMRGE